MKNVMKLAMMGLALGLSLSANAEMKIAVVNYQMALIESDSAKAYAKKSEARFGPLIDELKKIEDEGKRLQAKFTRDSAAMSAGEKKELQLELQRTAQDFEYKSKQLQGEKAQSDRVEIDALRPRLDKAIQSVVISGGYDLVLERSAVIFASPQTDITAQVIKTLNKGG